MATRAKTIQFATDTYTSVMTDATVTNLAQFTVYIPETVTAFRSVTVDVNFMDVITATGGTIDTHTVGLQLGAAGYSTITETDNITHSGENISGVVGPFDFTSYFTTNWTGTSMTCDIQTMFDQNTGTTLGMNNVNAVITITYEYDDDPTTNATQIKTVWIPMESLVGTLPTVANTNHSVIPALDSFLPEAGVTIRNYSFLIEGNVAINNNATDWTPTVNIDSGTSYAFGTIKGALITDRYTRLTWNPTVPSTASTHNFQMWSSITNRFNHVTVTMLITYEFTPASSTTILNSLILPVEFASPIGVTTSAEASRFTRDIFVEEPATISLMQSAYRINFNVAAAISGLNTRAGSQAYRTYTHTANVVAGMYSLQQRIDSGGAQGAGMTLARGRNTLVIDMYSTDTADQVTNVNGCIILNYHSSKASSGLVGQHAHTVMYKLLDWNAALSDRNRVSAFSINIPEANYWIVGAGFIFYQWVATASMAVTFDVECLSGEGKGGGYYDIYADAYQSDAERACSVVFMRGRDVFLRFPDDPDPDRLDIETARDYRLFTTTTTSNGMLALLTYHSFTYTVSDSITGFSGTTNIDLHRTINDEKVGTTSRVGDGSFSFTWYDNTEELYVQANDGTNVGRSQDTLAS